MLLPSADAVPSSCMVLPRSQVLYVFHQETHVARNVKAIYIANGNM